MPRGQQDINPVAVALAVASIGLDTARSATGRAVSALQPLSRVVLDPPWVPTRLRPGVWLETLSEGGEMHARALRAELTRRVDDLVPAVLDEVLRRVDATDLVLRNVDVDRLVAAVDLDAAAGGLDVAAVIERVDLDAVVRRVDVDAVVRRADLDAVIDRIDVDAVVRRVDLDAAAAQLDVDAVVRRADLDAAAAQLDVDAVVRRADLDAVIDRIDMDAVLDRLDLTGIVLTKVDLDAVVTAVLDRVDLIALANDIIEGVDLPRIIRESTGSMASETVQGARMQGVAADEAVSRVVDRLLLRRRERMGTTAYGNGAGSGPQAPNRTDDANGAGP